EGSHRRAKRTDNVMKPRTFVRPEAQSDIREAARWYESREIGLGLRFLREIRTALEHVTDNPRMFPIIEEDVRRALLHKFPYSIYFRKRTGSDRDYRRASSTPSTRRLEISSIGILVDRNSLFTIYHLRFTAFRGSSPTGARA